MPWTITRFQVMGLHKLGEVYFPGFAATRPEESLPDLLSSQGTVNRVAVHALLWMAAAYPRAALRALLRCEEPNVAPVFYACFGKLHAMAKGLCSILYCAKNDPRRVCTTPIDPPIDTTEAKTVFNLDETVAKFKESKSLRETYAKVLNHQGVKYFDALGHEGLEFVDSAPHHLIDAAGNRYLDFMASFATCHWGRNHPVIVSAMEQAARARYPNLLQFGVPTLATILADRLIAFLGGDFQHVFFTNTGAETTEYAMKMAMNVTGRAKLVYFTGDYHGLTLGALGVNGVTKQQKLFHVADQHIQVPFNDADALTAAFDQHAKEIAGVIIEPVQARHGFVAEDTFLELARTQCDKHGAVLIFDEIKTGFGRTGKNFFYQWSGVVPDIMLLAKGLSGGVCGSGALVFNNRVYKKVFHDVEQLGVYSSTFRENNMAMAVGLAVMHLMEHESCLENVLAAEALIRKKLDGASLSSGEAIEVRGKGLQLSVTLAGRKKRVAQSIVDSVEKDLIYMHAVRQLLTEKRVLSMIPNRFGAAIAVIPALNIPLELVEEFCDSVLEVLDELSSQSNLGVLKGAVKSARRLL